MTRNVHLLLAPMLALALTACDGKQLLGASERMWLWLVLPLCSFVLVGAILHYVRRRALSGGLDRRRERSEPAVKVILLTAIVLGLVVAGAFATYNFHLGIDPRQKLWNIGLWFLGTALGTSAGVGPWPPTTGALEIGDLDILLPTPHPHRRVSEQDEAADVVGGAPVAGGAAGVG